VWHLTMNIERIRFSPFFQSIHRNLNEQDSAFAPHGTHCGVLGRMWRWWWWR
jgi:hypothetical protein